jgi:diamine N-acetyltransferase
MITITLRFATEKDAELIADLSRETFYQTFAVENSKEDMDKFMNEQFTREALIKEVTTPGNIFLLALEDDVPAGYARLRENNNPPELKGSHAIELARIYAVSNAIGKGTGSALMQKCIEVAREKKYAILWLGVWEHNQRAIRFYTKWGFEKFATHLFVLGNDRQTDWLMKKNL